MGGRAIPAAAAVTVLSALVFITPLVLGIMQAARQAPALAALVANANNQGRIDGHQGRTRRAG